jgi:hypothetical protein
VISTLKVALNCVISQLFVKENRPFVKRKGDKVNKYSKAVKAVKAVKEVKFLSQKYLRTASVKNVFGFILWFHHQLIFVP